MDVLEDAQLQDANSVRGLLIVWCVGAQPILGFSQAGVKFLFVDPKVASDARITTYNSPELWCGRGPLVSASANSPSRPDQAHSATQTRTIHLCEWLLEGSVETPTTID